MKRSGVKPQTLDGIETENIDKNITLEELKEKIKEELLENGDDMSRTERHEFIESRIGEAGLNLSENEVNNAVQDVDIKALDESRFPTRGSRN